MEKEYTLNKQEFLAKEFFWYALISFFEGEFNPINWTIWNNFFMIIMFILFQLYVLGTCLTEKEEENGN
jgi:hypothetical protein